MNNRILQDAVRSLPATLDRSDCSPVIGQQPAPVFRTGTRLVEVTVTVLDKKGNAVSGLEPTDFTILDEGKLRPVALFHCDVVPEVTSQADHRLR